MHSPSKPLCVLLPFFFLSSFTLALALNPPPPLLTLNNNNDNNNSNSSNTPQPLTSPLQTPECYSLPSFRSTVSPSNCASSLAWFLSFAQRPHDPRIYHGSSGKLYFPPPKPPSPSHPRPDPHSSGIAADDYKCVFTLYSLYPSAVLEFNYMKLWARAQDIISYCSRKGGMGGRARLLNTGPFVEPGEEDTEVWLSVKGRKIVGLEER